MQNKFILFRDEYLDVKSNEKQEKYYLESQNNNYFWK